MGRRLAPNGCDGRLVPVPLPVPVPVVRLALALPPRSREGIGNGDGHGSGNGAGRECSAATAHHPSTQAKISGATMVASDSMMNLGVSSASLPQVIFSLGTAPEYEP